MNRSYPLWMVMTMLAIPLAEGQQNHDRQGQSPPRPPQATQQEIGAPSPTHTRTGRIERFTHAATGEVDGFVLSDGLTVHYPTYLSRQVTRMLGQDRQVEVTGLLIQGTDRNAATILEAQTITNLGTKRTLTVTGTRSAEPGTVTGAGAGTANSDASSTPASPPAGR